MKIPLGMSLRDTMRHISMTSSLSQGSGLPGGEMAVGVIRISTTIRLLNYSFAGKRQSPDHSSFFDMETKHCWGNKDVEF